ncbi:MAG: hypothetical protein WC676_00785 [Candidatus Omnitrophota bacterium]
MKIIIKIGIGFLVLVAIGLGAFYFVLNSTLLTPFAVRNIIHSSFRDVKVQSFECSHQRFYFPARLILEDVKLSIESSGQKQAISVKIIELKQMSGFLKPKKEIFCSLKEADISFFPATIQGLSLDVSFGVQGIDLEQISGYFKAQQLLAYDYSAQNIRSHFKGDNKKVHLNDLSAQFYKGDIKGEIFLDYASLLPYSARINLENVDLELIARSHPDIFSQVKGHLSGVVNMAGNIQKIRQLEADLSVFKDARIKASLLDFIADKLPYNSVQKRDLEALSSAGGDVGLDKLSVYFNTLSEKNLQGVVNLASQELNLDINLTIDVNLDNAFGRLLKKF